MRVRGSVDVFLFFICIYRICILYHMLQVFVYMKYFIINIRKTLVFDLIPTEEVDIQQTSLNVHVIIACKHFIMCNVSEHVFCSAFALLLGQQAYTLSCWNAFFPWDNLINIFIYLSHILIKDKKHIFFNMFLKMPPNLFVKNQCLLRCMSNSYLMQYSKVKAKLFSQCYQSI